MTWVWAAILAQGAALPLEKDFPKDESAFVRVAAAGALPGLAADPDGSALYVAFTQAGKVHVSVSTDAGRTFSPPRPVELPGPAHERRAPRLAVDRQHRLYLGAAAGDPPDLWLSVSKDRGATFSKPTLLNETPKAAKEGLFSLAAAPGEVHAAWIEDRGGKPALLAARYSDAGKRLGKPALLSPHTCERCPPALAADGAGNPLAAWRDVAKAAPSGRPLLLAHSSSRGGTWSPAAPASPIPSELLDCSGEGPAAALAPDGSLAALAWMDPRPVQDRNVFWSLGPPGKPALEDFVHKDRRYPQTRPALCIDSDGTAWCAWEDSILSAQRIFVRTSTNSRYLPIGDPKAESRFAAPALAAAGRIVALAYESGDGVAVRILAAP